MEIALKSIVTAARTIATTENWQEYLYPFIGIKPKDDFIRFRNGLSYKIRKNDGDKWVVLEVVVRNAYCPEGFGIGRGDTVIDVGGHIGAFSVLAASRAVRGRVFSFEPYPESYGFLRFNVRLNKLKNVRPVNLGVSGRKETRRLYVCKNGTCTNSAFLKQKNSVEIRCITMADIFRKYKIRRCNFLKMDCEGSEYDILFNMPDNVLRKIDKISMEYHDGMVKGCCHDDLKAFLESKGFRVAVTPPMIYATRC